MTHPSKCLSVPAHTKREIPEEEVFFADTLLRRGFPVVIEDDGLRLCLGTLQSEIDLLKPLVVPMMPSANEESFRLYWRRGTIAQISRDEALEFMIGPTRRPLLNYNPQRRETGLMGWQNVTTWEMFQKFRFGAKVSVERLEAGVALLVKVLPWVGVRTSMSCHGHDGKPPEVTFFGYYQSQWCEVIFNHLFADLPIAKTWRFRHGPEPGHWASAKWVATTHSIQSEEERHFIFDQIQIMARRLFDPELCRNVRSAKARATGGHDLKMPLKLHL